jgi:hypothetical protein
MTTIHLSQTTTATPGQFVAGLTDFGPTIKAIEARNYAGSA